MVYFMEYTKQNMEIGDAAMAMMGINHVTYIRPAQGEEGYAVYAADGTRLAVFPNYEAAYFTARQFNLTPLSVH